MKVNAKFIFGNRNNVSLHNLSWKAFRYDKVAVYLIHDDVIKWKDFPLHWPFVWRSPRHRWIPRTRASGAELWYFLWSAREQKVEETIVGFGDLSRHGGHYDVTVMYDIHEIIHYRSRFWTYEMVVWQL